MEKKNYRQAVESYISYLDNNWVLEFGGSDITEGLAGSAAYKQVKKELINLRNDLYSDFEKIKKEDVNEERYKEIIKDHRDKLDEKIGDHKALASGSLESIARTAAEKGVCGDLKKIRRKLYEFFPELKDESTD